MEGDAVRYTIEQRDECLVLGLPSQLAASLSSPSFWSALRADLCGLVCDKPSIQLYVDLRSVAAADTHSLFQLRAVIDQVRDLCAVTYLGPGPAVERLQKRGESPSLDPMLRRAPWESEVEEQTPQSTEFLEAARSAAQGLAADDPLLDALVSALEQRPGSQKRASAPAEQSHSALGSTDAPEQARLRGDAGSRSVATVHGRSVVFEVSWVPHPSSPVTAEARWNSRGGRRISAWHGPRCSVLAGWIPHQHVRTSYGHGTWLELHEGEVGVVITDDGGGDRLLVLCRREVDACPMVAPYFLALAGLSSETVKAVLRLPLLEVARTDENMNMNVNANPEQLNFSREKPSVKNTERELVRLI